MSIINRWIIIQLEREVKNLIMEMHQKVSSVLVRSYENIILPKFSAHGMVSKLRSKVCRSMLGWAHTRFREMLKYKAREYSCNVVIQDESYTSMTCSVCGRMNKVGSKKVFRCGCGVKMDRDWNGARGIVLRAMVDQPSLRTVLVSNC